MTFYYRNHEKADTALDELVRIPPKKRKSSPAENSKTESIVDDQRAATIDNQKSSTVDDQREATHLPKGHLPSLPKGSYPPAQREAGVSETTSEITSETIADEKSSLSNEELACFEWAKKETYWSKLVYSEKAFLKHYRSESQALKGQYQNWLALQQEEAQKNAPKKATPVKPIWQNMGFKSEQEYNAAHLRKLKQMEMDAKGGKAVHG